MNTDLRALAASFPLLVNAPDEPDRFAAWALSDTSEEDRVRALRPLLAGEAEVLRAQRVLLAGYVLSHLPPEQRSPLVSAIAWPSPEDDTSAARALLLLRGADHMALLGRLAAAWTRPALAAASESRARAQ